MRTCPSSACVRRAHARVHAPRALLVLMRMPVLLHLMPVILVVLVRRMLVLMGVIPVVMLIVGVRRALVDAELHALDAVALLALEVHVEVADVHLRELPLERGGLHTEVAKSADGHVAADAGKTVEKEDLHNREGESLADAAVSREKNVGEFRTRAPRSSPTRPARQFPVKRQEPLRRVRRLKELPLLLPMPRPQPAGIREVAQDFLRARARSPARRRVRRESRSRRREYIRPARRAAS